MAPLALTFICSGNAFSNGRRLQSSIFIEQQAEQNHGLLLDCGTTLLVGLQRCGLRFAD